MPIEHEMSDLQRGDVQIPGGWTAKVPEVKAVPDDDMPYVRYYISSGTHSIAGAESAVREAFQDLFTRSWLQGLRESILNRAEEYNRMFPELALRGFDPEVVQRAYVPGENTGRRGKPLVKKMLAEMGKAQREHEMREVQE